MVDRYDDRLRFTSMARTMARGDLKAQGLFTPEQVITGPLLKRLLEELAAENVRFEETTEEVRPLGSSTDRFDLSER
jgi:hypothetical protein